MIATTTVQQVPVNDSLKTFTPSRDISVEDRVWAAATLEHMETIIHFHPKRQTRVAQTSEGTYLRKAFAIVVTHRKNRFAINLYAGATIADLKRAQQLVEWAKQGWFLGTGVWHKREASGWMSNMFWSFNPEEFSPEIRACADSDCLHAWHEWETRGSEYQLDPCVHDKIRSDDYMIVLQRHTDEKWGVLTWQTSDEITCQESLTRWLNDFTYLQLEADKLNGVTQ